MFAPIQGEVAYTWNEVIRRWSNLILQSRSPTDILRKHTLLRRSEHGSMGDAVDLSPHTISHIAHPMEQDDPDGVRPRPTTPPPQFEATPVSKGKRGRPSTARSELAMCVSDLHREGVMQFRYKLTIEFLEEFFKQRDQWPLEKQVAYGSWSRLNEDDLTLYKATATAIFEKYSEEPTLQTAKERNTVMKRFQTDLRVAMRQRGIGSGRSERDQSSMAVEDAAVDVADEKETWTAGQRRAKARALNRLSDARGDGDVAPGVREDELNISCCHLNEKAIFKLRQTRRLRRRLTTSTRALAKTRARGRTSKRLVDEGGRHRFGQGIANVRGCRSQRVVPLFDIVLMTVVVPKVEKKDQPIADCAPVWGAQAFC